MEHPCLHRTTSTTPADLHALLADVGARLVATAVPVHEESPQRWELWYAAGKPLFVQWFDDGRGWEVYLPAWDRPPNVSQTFAAVRRYLTLPPAPFPAPPGAAPVP